MNHRPRYLVRPVPEIRYLFCPVPGIRYLVRPVPEIRYLNSSRKLGMPAYFVNLTPFLFSLRLCIRITVFIYTYCQFIQNKLDSCYTINRIINHINIFLVSCFSGWHLSASAGMNLEFGCGPLKKVSNRSKTVELSVATITIGSPFSIR